MATDERFKKKKEQVQTLLDDVKKLSRFDNSTVPTLLRLLSFQDPYNKEELLVLATTFHKEGGAELFMKMLTSLSPDGSSVSDSLQRVMEWSVGNITQYVLTPELSQTFVDCGGLKFLLSLLKHHACQGLMLRFESRNTLRFAVSTLGNLSTEPELKSCFHQELAADVLACYLDVPDAPCKLSALYALARVSTEQDLDIICNAQGAISLLTDMVNRPSYKDYTLLENQLYPATGLVETLTMVSITAGIRRKTLQPGAELDEEALQEILPELRKKLKVETEKRDYTLEWGDIAVHPTRRSMQKWPKARDGLIYVPYKVSVAFYDGDVKKIEEAALEFEKKTSVRFIPRSDETDYIYIHAWEGNWSFLGRQGGDQAMSLEPGKVTKGVVLHELMHALGFHHEHCRSDRDDHVLVLSENVKPEWKDAIEKKTSHEHNLTTPYDYSSITHYGMTAGSKDEHIPTMVPRNRSTMRHFGGGHTLSEGDVEKIKKMFDCEPATWGPSNVAPARTRPATGASTAHRDAGTSLERSTIESLVGVWNKSNLKDIGDKLKDPPIKCGGVKDNFSSQQVSHWPKHSDGNAYIPYKVSTAFYDYDVEAITSAVQEFEKKTCVRFYPVGSEGDFIHIQALDGHPSKNWSFLGRQGGDQALSLEPGKVTKGTVLHELMHALGFHHEHCRSDRGQHVFVLSDNVKDEWKRDIVHMKSTAQDLAAPYDCNSIMHYSMTAGSVDERNPTIIPKNPLLMLHMGHGNALSPCDVVKVQKLYGHDAELPAPETKASLAGAGQEGAGGRTEPLDNLIGAWRKKTEQEFKEEKEKKEMDLKSKADMIKNIIEEVKRQSSFDESTITALQCLLDILTAKCSEEEEAALHLAFKEHGGGHLLVRIMDAPKQKEVRTALLDMLSKVSNAMSMHTGGKNLGEDGMRTGDIAGDLSQKVVDWPKQPDGKVRIPYNISIAFPAKDRDVIEQAILEFNEKTCVRFIPRKRADDYINFQALGGSWSFLGKKGGAQSVSLEPGKVEKGTVLHELMHALGFHHEHCRHDRDQHVHIKEDNIKEVDLCQFSRMEDSNSDYGLPYDYISITHYSRYAASLDGVSPTIVPAREGKTPVGQRSFLSPLDVLKVHRKYHGPSTAADGSDEDVEKAVRETAALMETVEELPSELLEALGKESQETEMKNKMNEMARVVNDLRKRSSFDDSAVHILTSLHETLTIANLNVEERVALKTFFVKAGGPELFEKIRKSPCSDGSQFSLHTVTKLILEIMTMAAAEQGLDMKKLEPVREIVRDLKKLSRFDYSTVQTLNRLIEMMTFDSTKSEKIAMKTIFVLDGGAELLKKMQESPSPDDSEAPIQMVTELLFELLMSFTKEIDSEWDEGAIEPIIKLVTHLKKEYCFERKTVEVLKTLPAIMNLELPIEVKMNIKAAFLRAGGADLFKSLQQFPPPGSLGIKLQEAMADILTMMMNFSAKETPALADMCDDLDGLLDFKDLAVAADSHPPKRKQNDPAGGAASSPPKRKQDDDDLDMETVNEIIKAMEEN
ncbi:uncharacterized protein LOC116938262 isoform X1 [Petromyzon marinus]|uniref:uncharacterized protein LOC116938262 isoform X1 n=1 Tax=Petromyzon marinus TaxID=7757 RepID=UPI003F714960